MAKHKSKKPAIDREELAASYGWASSVLNSDKELKHKFDQAVKNTWSSQKFVAELMNTHWYRKHSAAWRSDQILRHADPGQWKQKQNQTYQHIVSMAQEMGSSMSRKTMAAMAANVNAFGWGDDQLKRTVSHYVRWHKEYGGYTGEASKIEDQLRTYAFRNGVRLSGDTLGKWIRDVSSGHVNTETIQNEIMRTAMSAFPAYADQLKGGMDMHSIASSYMQSMGQILEVNPDKITLFDPTIRQALTAKDEKGKPTGKPLWQFEQDLKSDPRWLKTKNAQDSLMTAGSRVLQDMGLLG